MKIAPLDLRQPRFRSTFRGFDRNEVVGFLAEAADDYECALRELDRQRQDLAQMETLLSEHREREANLRNTLLTAQKLADEVRENAHQEARVIVREAEGRADLVLQHTQARLDDFEREMTELRLRRGDVETSLEASIAALRHALDFIRAQDSPLRGENVRLHRPRQADADAPGAQRPLSLPVALNERHAQR